MNIEIVDKSTPDKKFKGMRTIPNFRNLKAVGVPDPWVVLRDVSYKIRVKTGYVWDYTEEEVLQMVEALAVLES